MISEPSGPSQILEYRQALIVLNRSFERIQADLGNSGGDTSLDNLFGAGRLLPGNSVELNSALDVLEPMRRRFRLAYERTYNTDKSRIDASVLRNELVWTMAYAEPGLDAEDLLLQFLVKQPGLNSETIKLVWYEGYEKAVDRMVEMALAGTSQGERVRQFDLISRMPETHQAHRNDLINATYAEIGNAIMSWFGTTDKGLDWTWTAAWASNAARNGIRSTDVKLYGDWLVVKRVRQNLADGNQKIFVDIGSEYARLIELLEASPNPSEGQWEMFFAGFEPGRKAIRDGFLLLVSARYEPDLAVAQANVLRANMLFLTTEQAGAQNELRNMDLALVSSRLQNAVFALRIGEWRLGIANDVDHDLVLLPTELGEPFPSQYGNNLIWVNPLSLDPWGQDITGLADTTGFSVEFGTPGAINGAVTVADIASVLPADQNHGGAGSDMQETWSGWHDRRGHNGDEAFPWTQTQTGEWSDYNQRMWYLLNLFHALIADTTQIDFAQNEAAGMEFEPFGDARVRPRFATSTLNKLLIELDGLPPVPQGLPDASSGSFYFTNTVGVPAGSSASLTSGTLPSGLTLNSSGAISGTPDGGGDFSFGMQAVDNGVVVSEGLFELTVVGPIVTSPEFYDGVPLPDIDAVVHYPGIAPEAPNYPTIVSYESVGNALPPNITLNTTTGAVTGSAFCWEWVGFGFEIRVTDSEGHHASKEFFTDQCI